MKYCPLYNILLAALVALLYLLIRHSKNRKKFTFAVCRVSSNLYSSVLFFFHCDHGDSVVALSNFSSSSPNLAYFLALYVLTCFHFWLKNYITFALTVSQFSSSLCISDNDHRFHVRIIKTSNLYGLLI